jgi:hypothetical protein
VNTAIFHLDRFAEHTFQNLDNLWQPVKVKYGSIHLLAILVSALYRYHQDFVIGIVDNVLEAVQRIEDYRGIDHLVVVELT